MANRFKIIRPGKNNNSKDSDTEIMGMFSSKNFFRSVPKNLADIQDSPYKMNQKIYLAKDDGKVYGVGKISDIHGQNCGGHEANDYYYSVDIDREVDDNGYVDEPDITHHSVHASDFEFHDFYSQEDYLMKFGKEPVLPDFDAMPRLD